jgi:hypothetical protein
MRGIALGCESFNMDGQPQPPKGKNFEFEQAGKEIKTVPIRVPEKFAWVTEGNKIYPAYW